MDKEVFKYYTLDIPKIDEEHLELINLMENVLECSKCEEHSTCKSNADILEQKFRDHLSAEELYMERINFPYIKAHIEQHNIIKEELNICINRLKDVKFKSDKYTTQKLREIFVRHIDEYDLQIAAYIRNVSR